MSPIFSDKLRELRTQKGLSQQDIAKITGKSRQAVNLWEKGDNEPAIETINKLADYFGVSTDYLLGRAPAIEIQFHETAGGYEGYDLDNPTDITRMTFDMKTALEIAVESELRTEEEAKEILETFLRQLEIMLKPRK